jgi:hypothetical protein
MSPQSIEAPARRAARMSIAVLSDCMREASSIRFVLDTNIGCLDEPACDGSYRFLVMCLTEGMAHAACTGECRRAKIGEK